VRLVLCASLPGFEILNFTRNATTGAIALTQPGD